jgi:hypothetical protein
MSAESSAAAVIQQRVRGKQVLQRAQERKAEVEAEMQTLGAASGGKAKQCSKCNLVAAIVHCYDCKKNYCQECDEMAHEDPNPSTLNDFHALKRPTAIKPSRRASIREEKLKHKADLLTRIVLFKRKKRVRCGDLFKMVVRASKPPPKPAIDQQPNLTGANYSLQLNSSELFAGMKKVGIHCTQHEVTQFVNKADEVNSTESPAAMKSSQNEAILTMFYNKVDPERVPEVKRDLAVGKPKILLGALKKRYGETPELVMMADPSQQRRGDKIVQLAEFAKIINQRESAMNAKKNNALKHRDLSGVEKMQHAWQKAHGE